MHDKLSIRRRGETCTGWRYLRTDEGVVYQSIFYRGRCRSDRAHYAKFAADDPAMNAAATILLEELVDEAVTLGHVN